MIVVYLLYMMNYVEGGASMSDLKMYERATWDWRRCRCQLPRFVYRLLDPRDRAVRYVGATGCTLEQRLINHIAASKGCGKQAAQPLYAWIRALATMGFTPVIQELGLVPWGRITEVEEYEIDRHKRSGCHLFNNRNRGYPEPYCQHF